MYLSVGLRTLQLSSLCVNILEASVRPVNVDEFDYCCRHSLRDECRVLAVHGILHTLGFDHESGDDGLQTMQGHEQAVLGALNWQVCCSMNFEN